MNKELNTLSHKRIKDLCQIIDCEHKTAPYVESSNYLVVRTSNVRNGNLIFDDIKFTTEEGFLEWTKRTIPSHRDVLFTREAPAGESCLVPKDFNICLGQRMVLLRPNNDRVDAQFLSIYLISEKCRNEIYKRSIGSTVSRINIEDIYKIPIALPPIAEQKKIAEILGTCDRLIELTEKLITAKRKLKRGLMQKLFSQKIRFKQDDGSGFPDWQKKKLGDLLTIRYGKDHKNLEDGQYPVLGTGGVMRYVDSYLYDKPSILIGRKGTIDQPQFITYPFWTVDTLFYSEISPNVVPFFLFLVVQSINWRKYNQATGVPSLNTTIINNVKIFVPTEKKEQKKIADCLTYLDREIEALNRKSKVLKQQKKGLMQQLLTGKTRVNVTP